MTRKFSKRFSLSSVETRMSPPEQLVWSAELDARRVDGVTGIVMDMGGVQRR
jgi:hypothetical protein